MGRLLLQKMEFGPGSSWSLGKNFVLRFTATGNLELWDGSKQQIVWETGTSAEKLAMQGDGNLVVYATGDSPVWSSATHGNPDAFLCLDDEGFLAVVTSDLTRTLWSCKKKSPTSIAEAVTESPLSEPGADCSAAPLPGGRLSAEQYRAQLASLEPGVRVRG